MKKIVAAMLMCAAAGAMAQPEQYASSCGVCHTSGAANAPKTHDVDAWAPRMEKGMPALLESVHNGLNAMPPKGMCFTCTDEQYTALIEYMAKPAE